MDLTYLLSTCVLRRLQIRIPLQLKRTCRSKRSNFEAAADLDEIEVERIAAGQQGFGARAYSRCVDRELSICKFRNICLENRF
jgi:hypothetical protein